MGGPIRASRNTSRYATDAREALTNPPSARFMYCREARNDEPASFVSRALGATTGPEPAKVVRALRTALARRLSRVAVCAAIVALLIASSTTWSLAFSNSIYSVAVDDGYPNQTTGVYSSHACAPLSLSGTNCFDRYNESANPIVFTQWVMGDAGLSSQVELGVEEQFSGYTFLFWGWRTSSSGWQEMGHIDIPADSNGHTFDIHRLGNVWYYLYDGAQELALSWTLTGIRAAAGIESDNTSDVVPTHWFSLLRTTVNEGPWIDFAFNQTIVNAPMCGAWSIPYTRWSAAENYTC